MIPGGTRPGEPSAPLRLGGLPLGPRHVPVLLLETRKNSGTAWRPQAGLTVSTAASTAPVRGYFCSRPWLSKPAAHGRIAGRLQPGTEPRTAYALVSGVRLGERRAAVKPSASPTLVRTQQLPRHNTCHTLRKRPAESWGFPAVRAVSTSPAVCHPCRAADRGVATSTDTWRTASGLPGRSVRTVGFFTDGHGRACRRGGSGLAIRAGNTVNYTVLVSGLTAGLTLRSCSSAARSSGLQGLE
jgi:hypothetical protein